MFLSYPVHPVNPVKISRRSRRTLFAVLLTLLLAGPLRAGIAQDVSELPEQTLGFVVVSDLGQFDASLRRLLAPWGLRFAGVEPTLGTVCPQLSLAKRPLLIGLAEADSELTPFLLLPVDDLEAMADAIHADRAGDDLIATIAGYDLKIMPVPGGVRISPLGANVFTDPSAELLQELKPLVADSVAMLRVTNLGLERIAVQLSRERDRNRPSRPNRLRIRTFADLWSARSLLPAYAPLMETLSHEAKSVTIKIQALAEKDILLSCEAILEEAPDELASSSGSSLPSIETLAGGREPILSFEGDRPIPALLVRLALATIESRPNALDTARFASHEFAAFTEAAEKLVASITAIRDLTLTPPADEPLTANQVRLVQVRPGTPFAQFIKETTFRWNEVLRASKADPPLEVKVTPLVNHGVRLSTNVVAAMGGPDVEGLVPLLEQFYGPQGVRTVDCLPLKDGEQWLITSLPATATAEISGRLSTEVASPATKPTTGELQLDRWFAWRQRIEDVGHEKTIGRRVRPPMREALPLQFHLSDEGDRFAVHLEIPVDTYEALAEYWRAKKVATD